MGEQAAAETRSFLALLDEPDRREFENRAATRRFKAGSTLMHEGAPGAEVMLLLRGRVKVTVATVDGKEIVLQFCGPGELLGELSVIDEVPRSGTTEALEPIEALAISATDFRALVATRPGFANALVRHLVHRYRNADRMRIEFAAAQTLGRVAARLVELVDRHGETAEDGMVITLPLSQEELAGWTGSSREAVAKALQALRSLDLIRTERRRITVLDVDALRRQAA